MVQRRPVTLVCDVTGVPPPTVTWSQDGRRVSEEADGRRRLLKGGRVLQLRAAFVRDAGVYQCSAENVAGVDRKQFRLHVIGTSTHNHEHTYDTIRYVNVRCSKT